ncbi:beta-galactosidase [Parasediminibacterium sp. JCM 36343]|uniref:beta-galactosidase n=1 Tax=Parasediminibacterium sp. JCM 36343 TaxID=3374279 RepID=UPI00397DB9B9
MQKFTTIFIVFFHIASFCFGQSFQLGADYYPEHFPIENVSRDAQLMKAGGLNIVRMGDFAWFNMQPDNHTYTLDWLVKTVDTLGKYQMKSLLCTPTAAIPKWMFDQYPDIMQVTETGQRKPYGKRRHACLNNESYRQYSLKISEQLATTFANNPNVEGFQIDNELMAEDPYCYCETCRQKFASWLKEKYKTLETLNKTWGLAFWSENLTDFNQVFLPRKGDNPGCFVDYQEFYSDCTIDYFNLQRNAIKKIAPRLKVTHNICSSGFIYKLDMYKLARNCDFLSIDNYPYTWTLENEYAPVDNFDFHPAMASMALSQIRGASKKPFWVTEQQISRTAGKQRKMIEPGMVRLWCHQGLAHGAESILFFPYRTFEYAHEQMMNGVLDADNIPRRRYEEVKQTSSELSKIKALLGNAFPVAKAAVLRDFKCDWAFEDGRVSSDFRYMRHIYAYYRALREQGITTDIVSPTDNLSAYPLVLVPAQILVTPELCAQLKKAAENGSTIVITCMTGLRNPSMKSFGRLLNKGIESLAGIEMEEQFALIKQENTAIDFPSHSINQGYTGSLWYDHFKPLSAEVLATYQSRFLKGKPAVVKNRVGKGAVYYIGTVPSDSMINELVHDFIANAHISPLAKCANKLVDITELKDKKSYMYAINFSQEDQPIELSTPMKDIFTNKTAKAVTVKAMDVLVLEKE